MTLGVYPPPPPNILCVIGFLTRWLQVMLKTTSVGSLVVGLIQLSFYNCVMSLRKVRKKVSWIELHWPFLFLLFFAAGQVTSWSRSSKNTGTSSTWVRHQHKKPSEVSQCGSLVQSTGHVQYTEMCLMEHSLCLAITSLQFCLSSLRSGICCGFAELS